MEKLSEEQLGHLEEFVRDLDTYLERETDEDEDEYRTVAPDFLEKVREHGHAIFDFDLEDAPLYGTMLAFGNRVRLELYCKGSGSREQVADVAQILKDERSELGVEHRYMHGFPVVMIPGIEMFPQGKEWLTVDKLVELYVHPLHEAAEYFRELNPKRG